MFFFLFLLYKKIVPWGSFKVEYDFSRPHHPFFSALRPDSRLGKTMESDGEIFKEITAEPVYFDIETPRSFKRLDLEAEYKFPDWQRGSYDLKAGILADNELWQFRLQPLENTKMERLINDWDTIREGDIIFAQGIRKYNSIGQFLNNLPPNRKSFAAYNYNLNNDLKLDNYEGRSAHWELPAALKGYHQFYTYIKDEPLDFYVNFKSNDLKFAEGLAINIYRGNSLVLSKGLFEGDKFLDELRIYQEDLDEGVYKVEIKITDDVFIDKLSAKQSSISFINKLNFADSGDERPPLKLYTDSPSLKVAATVKESLQDISVGDKNLKIDELFKQFEAKNYSCLDFEKFGQNNCISEISLSRGKLLIQGPGLFSFSRESFINPQIQSLEHIDNFSDLTYVIADYESPETRGKWKIAKTSFDISGIIQECHTYKFILAIQGLGENEKLYINKIKAEFK